MSKWERFGENFTAVAEIALYLLFVGVILWTFVGAPLLFFIRD